MKKQLFGILSATVLAGVFIAAPVAADQPRQRYEVSPDFTNCTERIYKDKRPMMRDWCVWRIQNFLNEMKWMRGADGKSNDNWPSLKLDSIYGPETAKAVKAYQRATRSDGVRGNAGQIDGIVGPKTWRTIRADCVDHWADHDFHSLSCYVIEQ